MFLIRHSLKEMKYADIGIADKQKFDEKKLSEEVRTLAYKLLQEIIKKRY